MTIEVTVTKVVHRKDQAGLRYLSVTIDRGEGSITRLVYMQTFEHEPVKGERVSIDGMPLMYGPRRGHVTPNIGAVKVTVLPEGELCAWTT